MRRLAVYCGSNSGVDPQFTDAAKALGREMAARDIGLVYGGGKLGLMGVIADAVLEADGEVHGVIPEALVDLEVAHRGLTELHIVPSMHERKAKMTDLCDGFVAMPGGIGTLDELFEAWSWNALGYHAKPFLLLNIAGFWDSLISFIDQVVVSGFISAARREHLLVSTDIADAIAQLETAENGAKQGMVW